jgi:RNA polymerase sigma factor (sigma-70 family)
MVADPFARTVTRLGQLGGADSDPELLRRFTVAGDHAAFAALVRRHGPMVFGVCRRTLGHIQDAEDAFQATFLVLARRAHAVRPDGVSRWLYGVAVRVANKARVRRARRSAVPAELNEVPATPAPPPADWVPLLDTALSRLPDRDRRPILLCDLQGRSRAEAAAELGIAEGTLSSRLARARAKLRSKLVRLGVVPTVAATSVLVPDPVPAALVESTLTGAAPAARQLAEGVVRSMFLAKITSVTAAATLAVGVVTVGVVAVPGAGADPAPASKPAGKEKAPPPAAKDDAKPKAGALPDADRINGTWVVEELVHSGRNAADARALMGKEIAFDHGRLTTDLLPGRQKAYRLDPGWDPKRIDLVLRDTPDRGPSLIEGRADLKDVTIPAIYKFDGDRLHLGIASSGKKERPESFGGKAELFTHVVLRKKPSADRPDPERQALEGTWELMAVDGGGIRRSMTDSKLVMEGRRLLIYPRGQTTPTETEYTVDSKRAPRHIDVTIKADRDQLKTGDTIKGAYALDGNVLTIVFGGPGEERPTSLSDKNRPVMHYRRAGTDAKPPPGAPSPRLRELQQQRVKALQEQLEGGVEFGRQFENFKIGKEPLIHFLEVVRELCEARLELADTREQRLAAVEEMVKTLRKAEEHVDQLQAAGFQTKQAAGQARAARLKAEIQLEKLKSEE